MEIKKRILKIIENIKNNKEDFYRVLFKRESILWEKSI